MKVNKILFSLSCAMFVLSALAMGLSVAGDYNGNRYALFFAILSASMFWGCLSLAIILLVIVNHRRKKNGFITKDRKTLLKRAGALRFFSNVPAAVFDVLTVLLFISTAATMFIPAASDYVTLLLLMLTLICVYMHSMLNGINFIYISGKYSGRRVSTAKSK